MRPSARALALDLLIQFDQSPFPISGPLEQVESRLEDPRERHLARALVIEVLRHRARLDWLIGQWLRRGGASDLPAPARNVLRIGAAQLLLFDRIPPHAAVSSAVDLAHSRGAAGLPGLVNAVLRKLAREGRAQWDALDAGGEPGSSVGGALALRHSHPEWLVARWLARWGEARTEAILRWDNTAPDYWLRLAPGAAPPEGSVPGWIPGTARLPAGSRPGSSEGFRAGEFTVQDGSATLVGWLPPVVSGLVLDLCAAPGTKLSHLIERAEPDAALVALDKSPSRLQRLLQGDRSRTVLSPQEGERARERVWVAAADAAHIPVRGPWQGVLIDAPCSNLGVLRRRVDARWRVQEEGIAQLASLQASLLEAAARNLEPGGWLVYSVCTVEPEETIERRREFMKRRPDWEPIPLPEFIPADVRMEPGEFLLLPGQHETDGTYAFAVRRPGGASGSRGD